MPNSGSQAPRRIRYLSPVSRRQVAADCLVPWQLGGGAAEGGSVYRVLAAISVVAMLALAGCGEDGPSTETRSTTLPSSVPASVPTTVASTTSSTRLATTVARPTTTRPRATTTLAATPVPTTSPPTTAGVPTVALGQSFTLGLGQAVTVSGPGLTVTFAAVVEDSRCPIGSQCVWAGRAVISLTVAKAGMVPATLAVSNEGPPSSRYGSNTIELVLLSRSEPRLAALRVT